MRHVIVTGPIMDYDNTGCPAEHGACL